MIVQHSVVDCRELDSAPQKMVRSTRYGSPCHSGEATGA